MVPDIPLACRRDLLVGLVLPVVVAAPGAVAAEPRLAGGLAALDRFVGTWRGEGEGEPGLSQVERVYEPALGGRFLVARNTSRYAPQPKNPKGEVHQDIGWYSFDRAGRTAVFRQFHSEGFVLHYAAPAEALAGNVLVFDTVAIENIPSGWRARESFAFSGADAFEERFEIAEPGKPYSTYSLNRLRRA